MKTFIRTTLISATCLIAASCLQDVSLKSGHKNNEPLTISTEKETKTSLNGSEIHWSSDDVVAIFDNSNAKNKFQAVSTNGSNAAFSGEVTSGTTLIYAVYPYNLANSANAGTLNVTIPTEQKSKDGSFAEEHNISVAKAAKNPGVEVVNGISFKNVCAYLKFTVPAYLSDVAKVTLSSNSIIAGNMAVDYSGENPVCTIPAEGSKSISMTGSYAAGSTFWFVLAPVTLDGINITVETGKGMYSMSTDEQFEMTAGNYRTLGTLNLAPASISNATAKHTYDNGKLTGTEVSVNLGIPESTVAYITAMTLHLKNSDGTILRTSNMNAIAEKIVMPAEGSWPYLPKGKYTVSGTYTLSGATEKTIKDIEFNITENPEFEVTATTPYTSYSKYISGDAAGANSLDGSTIYNVGATVSVSDAILNNANYPSLSITDNGTTVSAGNLSSRSWGKHTIKASYTLDGVTASSEASVDVTGLPYSYNFENGSLEKFRNDGWTTNGNLRVSNESLARRTSALVLQHRRYSKVIWVLFDENEKGYVVSPKFHAPENINVQPCIERSLYNASGEISRKGYVGAVSSTTATNTQSISYTVSGGNSTQESLKGTDDWMNSFILSSAAPYISVDCDTRNNGDLGCYFFLHKAHFRYAQ